MRTLADLLSAVTDPAQPLITYYDAATSERIELSATTTANWVAKTANFLVDGLDAEPGTRIRIGLPSHWETYVWLLAAWQTGCVLTDGPADIAVVGPEPEPDSTESTRVALSLRPLGARFPTPPASHIDFNAEVLGYSDFFLAMDPPGPHALAIDIAGCRLTHHQALEAWPGRTGRVLVAPSPLMDDIAKLISTVGSGGSLVLVAGASVVRRNAIASDERADEW